MATRLYCYICGKTLGDSMHLITMREETDRVFLSCDSSDCVDQVESGTTIIRVSKTTTGRE